MGYISRSPNWEWIYKYFVLSMLSENKSQMIKVYKDFILEEDSKEIVERLDNFRWPVL